MVSGAISQPTAYRNCQVFSIFLKANKVGDVFRDCAILFPKCSSRKIFLFFSSATFSDVSSKVGPLEYIQNNNLRMSLGQPYLPLYLNNRSISRDLLPSTKGHCEDRGIEVELI